MDIATEFETFEQQCMELTQELQTISVSKRNILVLNNTHISKLAQTPLTMICILLPKISV